MKHERVPATDDNYESPLEAQPISSNNLIELRHNKFVQLKQVRHALKRVGEAAESLYTSHGTYKDMCIIQEVRWSW